MNRIPKIGDMHTIPEGLTVPFCSVRLPDFHTCQFQPGQENDILKLFKQFPDVCDGVWFATDYGYPAIAVHHESARRMAEMAKTLRTAGIACSLQISNTLGHRDSYHHPNEGITWTDTMVGLDGQQTANCHCPRSPGFREYLRVTLTAYVRFQPDYVWIDDDLRMQSHMPASLGCFCDACLHAFSVSTSGSGRPAVPTSDWTREGLGTALAQPDYGTLRATWITFNQAQLAELSTFISETIWSVSPKTRMGIQQANCEVALYNGRDFVPSYRAISRHGHMPAGCRAGGGHYTDFANRSMLAKAFDISRQFANLPEGVPVRCPEIENFVHGAIGKTPLGTALEAAVDIAVGSNCLSIANMMYQNEEIAWHAGTFRTLSCWKPYMETLIRESGTAILGGMEVILPRHQTSRTLRADESATAWTTASLAPAYQLASIGLPLCTSPMTRTAGILAPEAAKGITEAELREAVQQGVLMDGVTAFILQERGYADIIGARIRKLPNYHSPEYFTDDPLNGKNTARAFLDNPFNANAGHYAVEPLVGDVRVLGTFKEANGTDTGILTAGIKLPDGGRVGIIGRNAWETVISTKRRTQILNLADWVSGHRLPIVIETGCQVVPLVRREAGGRIRTITLLNQGFDASPPLFLRIRLHSSQQGSFRWMQPEGSMVPLSARRSGEDWLLDLAPIARWSIGTLFCA